MIAKLEICEPETIYNIVNGSECMQDIDTPLCAAIEFYLKDVGFNNDDAYMLSGEIFNAYLRLEHGIK
jgi:hypothetical protein